MTLAFSSQPVVSQSENNFSTGNQTARLFGVHEITLTGGTPAENPFTTVVRVTFQPPSGAAKAIDAFYDGGATWRARVYITETGDWNWFSESTDDPQLNGQRGTFTAVPSDLRGMLKPHPRNPRQWMTDNQQWFLNINDTAYRLFNADESQWQPYIHDVVALGITSVRSGALGGWAWGKDAESSNYPWEGDDLTRYDLKKFQATDERLQWMLNHYPSLYVQMIIFGQVDWQTDEVGTAWREIPPAVRENTMRYMIARWAAYPQIFWLTVNDMSCTEDFPNNRRFGREVGRYFAAHDPWQHLVSVSPTREMTFCYLGQEDADWVGYIHLQDQFALGAERIKQYQNYPLHVFLAEDYYEQDHDTRYPRTPRYFQRWLFWSWILSGGSANYGGRYPVLHPYNEAGQQPFEFNGRRWGGLSGLDSVPYIASYFSQRGIDLSQFQPDDSLVSDVAGRNVKRRPELMRREDDEFLIYHPNAYSAERTAHLDFSITPAVRLDLREVEGVFATEWYRAYDGLTQAGGPVVGGDYRELTSPWKAYDVVLRLVRVGYVPHETD
ncbi:MAG: DUF5060 domain-containing protein [Chloroflexi bacterium]|nr:DUF5060 domain-containing protein [Chloroflexota bacterium]